MAFPLFVLTALVIAAATMGVCWLLRGRPLLAISAGLAGAYGLLVLHGPVYFNRFPGDDAYITFRYAQHLADGLGPNWNSSGRVEGYTSFLWLALLAGPAKLGFDVVETARVLTYVATFGTMLLVLALWRDWSRGADDSGGLRSPLVPAAALLSLAIVDGVSFWSFSGLETPFYMMLLTGGALVAMRERRAGGFVPWSAIVFAGVAMTRPEGFLAAAVTGLFTLDGIQRSETRGAALLRAGTWAATFFALYGSYFAWRWAYYDSFFPNTYYAKVERSLLVYERGASYLSSAVLNYHVLPALAGVALLSLVPRLRRDAAYVGVLTAALLLAFIPEGGDAFGHGRLIVPMLPLLYFAALSGYAVALARLQLAAVQRAAAASAALAVFALLLLNGSDNPFLPEDRQANLDRKTIGLWMNEHAPEDYTIGAWAVGAVAYYSERDMLDLFGLTDAVIAHTEVDDFGAGIPGHERYNADYVLDDVQPEIIITSDGLPNALGPDAFWRLFGAGGSLPGKDAIMTDPRTRDLYDVRAVQIDGRWFHFLQRKDTVAQLQAPGLR